MRSASSSSRPGIAWYRRNSCSIAYPRQDFRVYTLSINVVYARSFRGVDLRHCGAHHGEAVEVVGLHEGAEAVAVPDEEGGLHGLVLAKGCVPPGRVQV